MIRVLGRYRRIIELAAQQHETYQVNRAQVRKSDKRMKITVTDGSHIWGQVTAFPKDPWKDADGCLFISRDKWETAFKNKELVVMKQHNEVVLEEENDCDFPEDGDVLDHVHEPLSTIYVDVSVLNKVTSVLASLGRFEEGAVRVDILPVQGGHVGLRFSMPMEQDEKAHVCIYVGELVGNPFSPFPEGEEPEEEEKRAIKRVLEV